MIQMVVYVQKFFESCRRATNTSTPSQRQDRKVVAPAILDEGHCPREHMWHLRQQDDSEDGHDPHSEEMMLDVDDRFQLPREVRPRGLMA
jgi:hypothetical protein